MVILMHKNRDNIYILLSFEERQAVCFRLSFYDDDKINLEESGNSPPRDVNTIDDPRFGVLCMDSLNLKTSQIIPICIEISAVFGPQRQSR
jgi:hypothetical protein